MTPADLAAIVARDRDAGSGRLPDSALPEYQCLADRRALLALLRETREALAGVMLPEAWQEMPIRLGWATTGWVTFLTTEHKDRINAHLAALSEPREPAP